MKVRTKLTAGFSLIVVLVWIVVFLAVNGYWEMREHHDVMEEDIVPTMIAITDMAMVADDIYHEIAGYTRYGTVEIKQSALANLEYLEELGLEHLAWKTRVGQEEEKTAQELMAKIIIFSSSAAEMISLKDQWASPLELEAGDLKSWITLF